MLKFDKVLQLLMLAPSRPIEVWDRLATIVELKTDDIAVAPNDYSPVPWEFLISELDRTLDPACSTYAAEEGLRTVEGWVKERQSTFAKSRKLSFVHDGDEVLGRLCYIVCRAVKPDIVVETGVAFGVTSSYLLQAMSVNNYGMLHSVDFPSLDVESVDEVGALIPRELRERWTLHVGPSKRVLPDLLGRLQKVDLFIHDSLHTYRTMKWEFETVEPYLSPGATVISDDVQGNRAFAEWGMRRSNVLHLVVSENAKDSMLGINVGR
jgi:predicted O-methyltransferase YrrM